MTREFLCMIWPLRKATTGDAFKIMFKKDFPHPPCKVTEQDLTGEKKEQSELCKRTGPPRKVAKQDFAGRRRNDEAV